MKCHWEEDKWLSGGLLKSLDLHPSCSNCAHGERGWGGGGR